MKVQRVVEVTIRALLASALKISGWSASRSSGFILESTRYNCKLAHDKNEIEAVCFMMLSTYQSV
jgi:hypothetical protein